MTNGGNSENGWVPFFPAEWLKAVDKSGRPALSNALSDLDSLVARHYGQITNVGTGANANRMFVELRFLEKTVDATSAKRSWGATVICDIFKDGSVAVPEISSAAAWTPVLRDQVRDRLSTIAAILKG